MRTEHIAMMRKIWDDQMRADGFIWKYKVWLHIDFDQRWFATIVPRSVAQGHCVDTGYIVNSIDQLNPDILRKELRYFSAPEATQLIRGDQEKPIGCYDHVISEATFSRMLDEYRTIVREPLLQIQSIEDMVRFNVDNTWHGKPPYWICRRFVQLLLFAGLPAEASHMASLMHAHAIWLRACDEENIQTDEKKIMQLRDSDQHQSWYTQKDKARDIEVYTKDIAILRERIQRHNMALSEASELQRKIASKQYSDIMEETRKGLDISADSLSRLFTKSEKAMMSRTVSS